MTRVCNLDDVGCDVKVFTLGCDVIKVYDLGPDDDADCDIRVFVPGPQGPPGSPIFDVGSFLSPVAVVDTIAAPIRRWQRSFIQATAAPVDQPVIANPSDNGPWLIGLQVVGGNPITLNDAANIKLSGQWIGSPDSVLWLLWDGNSRYVEDHRNEI